MIKCPACGSYLFSGKLDESEEMVCPNCDLGATHLTDERFYLILNNLSQCFSDYSITIKSGDFIIITILLKANCQYMAEGMKNVKEMHISYNNDIIYDGWVKFKSALMWDIDADGNKSFMYKYEGRLMP